jgi:hypothetical protein
VKTLLTAIVLAVVIGVLNGLLANAIAAAIPAHAQGAAAVPCYVTQRMFDAPRIYGSYDTTVVDEWGGLVTLNEYATSGHVLIARGVAQDGYNVGVFTAGNQPCAPVPGMVGK